MDDRRVGLIVRALRRRRGWRQSDLAAASEVSQPTISLFERGHLDTLHLRRVRRIFAALDARGELEVRWRGGDLDRTLDEGHAQLVGRAVAELRLNSRDTAIEVTYSIFGERGSIDLLGFHQASGSLAVIEVKTELTSIEETLRRHDEKVRLAGRIGLERFWLEGLEHLPASGPAGPSRHEKKCAEARCCARCRAARQDRGRSTLARRSRPGDPWSLVSGDYSSG